MRGIPRLLNNIEAQAAADRQIYRLAWKGNEIAPTMRSKLTIIPICGLPLRSLALGGLFTGAVLAVGGAPAGAPRDAAAKVDFTFTGQGHTDEVVHLRDVYPAGVEPPSARFYKSGITFGIPDPILELKAGNLGPKMWRLHFLLKNVDGAKTLPVDSPQPALIVNGDNGPRQQSFYPVLTFLDGEHRGNLAVTLLPSPKNRVRGTFAGTLVFTDGTYVTVTKGSFDLPRLKDLG